MENLVGTVAATLTTVSFLPQVIKILKTKHTKDISLTMYLIFTAGVACWLFYGVLIDRPPVIIANSVTLVLTSIILAVKIRHG